MKLPAVPAAQQQEEGSHKAEGRQRSQGRQLEEDKIEAAAQGLVKLPKRTMQ